MAPTWKSEETPVCVLGLGLIGGSLLQARPRPAGRRSATTARTKAPGTVPATPGFAATTDLTDALTWPPSAGR